MPTKPIVTVGKFEVIRTSAGRYAVKPVGVIGTYGKLWSTFYTVACSPEDAVNRALLRGHFTKFLETEKE